MLPACWVLYALPPVFPSLFKVPSFNLVFSCLVSSSLSPPPSLSLSNSICSLSLSVLSLSLSLSLSFFPFFLSFLFFLSFFLFDCHLLFVALHSGNCFLTVRLWQQLHFISQCCNLSEWLKFKNKERHHPVPRFSLNDGCPCCPHGPVD